MATQRTPEQYEQHKAYMREWMRMKARANRLGITVNEFKARPDFAALMATPTRQIPEGGGRVVERWSWLGGCYYRGVHDSSPSC